MALSPNQERILRAIGEDLASDDPRLARQLGRSSPRPVGGAGAFRHSDITVMALLFAAIVVACLPVIIGAAVHSQVLMTVGAYTAIVACPAILWWAARRLRP